MNYGNYGGQHVENRMILVLEEIEKNFKEYCYTKEFRELYSYYLHDYVGRPSKLYYAENLTKKLRRSKDISKKRRPKPHRFS